MTGFINLLLESPLLLFLILAAIFSFIQSRNSSKQEETRERPRPQQQEQGRTQRPPGEGRPDVDWKDIFFEREETKQEPKKQEPQRHAPAEAESSKSMTAIQEHYEKAKKKQRLAEESAGKIENSPIVKGDITSQANQKIDLDFKNISKQDVIKGVVWSEVLGKPRSRQKKHR